MATRRTHTARPFPPGRPTPAQTRERAAVLEPLRKRMYAAIDALAEQAPLELLRLASAAQTGAGSIAAMLSRLPEANPALAGADPEAAAVARMADVKRRLLETVPTLSTAEIARRLRITEAGVRKARAEGRLLAVDFDGQRYPAFQLSADGIRPGIREVLAALDDVPMTSDWVRLDFLTAPHAHEDGRSVAELLRDGDVPAALAVARHYGEMGG
jgi:hypothetical protein